MIKISEPIIAFNTVLALPYFLLEDNFCTNPTDVPATMASMPCPIEYNSNNNIPQRILPFPATMASNAISTGVEQGDEKMPPSIPAMNAPVKPFFVFFETR